MTAVGDSTPATRPTAAVPTAAGPTAARVAAGLGIAAVASIAVNALIATIALAAGASSEFPPLSFGTYAAFTVAGVLAGAAGWALVRKRSRRPAAVLRILVPAVTLVSLVPDLGVLFSGSMPGTNGIGVLGLMVMHVAIAAIAVPVFQRILPVGDR